MNSYVELVDLARAHGLYVELRCGDRQGASGAERRDVKQILLTGGGPGTGKTVAIDQRPTTLGTLVENARALLASLNRYLDERMA